MSTDASGPSGGVVTISASYGAGGSVIAPLVAVRLGLPFADRLIPARAPAEGAGEQLSDEEREESAKASFLARLGHMTGGLAMPVPHSEDLGQQIRQRVEASIHELARSGGAVILGRAASVVLAGSPRAYHVRLDGPEKRRVVRAAEIERIDLELAHQRLIETDRARARYLSRLYGQDPADPSLYHLVIDSTVLTTDDGVELIASAATAFWR